MTNHRSGCEKFRAGLWLSVVKNGHSVLQVQHFFITFIPLMFFLKEKQTKYTIHTVALLTGKIKKLLTPLSLSDVAFGDTVPSNILSSNCAELGVATTSFYKFCIGLVLWCLDFFFKRHHLRFSVKGLAAS